MLRGTFQPPPFSPARSASTLSHLRKKARAPWIRGRCLSKEQWSLQWTGTQAKLQNPLEAAPIPLASCFISWNQCHISFIYYCSFFFFFWLSGPHLWHMEVPRLGAELELQLPAYTTATAIQHWILNPLREARDGTRNLMVTSWICFCCTTTGTPIAHSYK